MNSIRICNLITAVFRSLFAECNAILNFENVKSPYLQVAANKITCTIYNNVDIQMIAETTHSLTHQFAHISLTELHI